MSEKIKKLFIKIKSAKPFKDDFFWEEMLRNEIVDDVSNFEIKEWEEFSSIFPQGKREIDFCLLDIIICAAPDEILSSVIERTVDLICGDEELLGLLLNKPFELKISKLSLNDTVKNKLKHACYNRLHKVDTYIAHYEIEKKSILNIVKHF